jgi:alcohol dehydrogenase YqhD (iron-dependent ADH family)
LATKFNDITVKTKLKDYSLDEDCEKEIIKKQSTKNSVLKFDEKQHKYVLKQ